MFDVDVRELWAFCPRCLDRPSIVEDLMGIDEDKPYPYCPAVHDGKLCGLPLHMTPVALPGEEKMSHLEEPNKECPG